MNLATHGLTGWILAQSLSDRRDRGIITAAALAADIDGVGIVSSLEAYQTYHHVLGHNIFVAVAITFISFILCRDRMRGAFLSFVSFHSHLLEDLLGSGREWPLEYFWPVWRNEYAFSPPFQWELVSWQNVAITALLFVVVGWIGTKRGRTILELVSLSADRKVTEALILRFGKK